MAKSVDDLKKAIRAAMRAVKSGKWEDAADQVGAALDALKEAQAELEDYGYAYGYAEPKAQDVASAVKKALQSAKRAINKEDADAALEALQQALDALGAKKMVAEFKVFEQDGKVRWLTISSGGFEDRDGEVVSTAFLQSAVKQADVTGDRGPLQVLHIPGSRIGECDFQAVVGGFLLESGTFDDTPAGQAAAKFLSEHAGEYGVSIGFLYKNRTPDGVFEPPGVIIERSVLPKDMAAFPWSAIEVEDLEVKGMIDERKKEELVRIVGEEEAERILSQVEQHAKALREAGIRFKETESGTEGEANDKAKEQGPYSYELVLSPESLQTIAKELSDDISAAVEEKTAATMRAVEELQAAVKSLAETVDRLAQAEDARLEEKVRNLPRATLRRVAVRPTRDNPVLKEGDGNEPESLVERGLRTLYED